MLPTLGVTRTLRRSLKGLTLLLLPIGLGAGSLQTGDGPPPRANDPFEPVNRVIFDLNKNILDKYILIPLAKLHNRALPRPARITIRHFLNNLKEPVTAENEMLQGKFGEAGETIGRFGINTTLGVAGFMEVAQGLGLKRHVEDFGQTLGSYGVGQGPYLVLPILGSSSARDLTGRVADHFMNPLDLANYPNQTYVSLGLEGMTVIEDRAHKIKEQIRAGAEHRPTGYTRERDDYLKREDDEAHDRASEADEVEETGNTPSASAASSLRVMPPVGMNADAIERIEASLGEMKLPVTKIAVIGERLMIIVQQVNEAPLACDTIWQSVPLDSLSGVNSASVSEDSGNGAAYSCTKFLSAPTPMPAARTAPAEPGM